MKSFKDLSSGRVNKVPIVQVGVDLRDLSTYPACQPLPLNRTEIASFRKQTRVVNALNECRKTQGAPNVETWSKHTAVLVGSRMSRHRNVVEDREVKTWPQLLQTWIKNTGFKRV